MEKERNKHRIYNYAGESPRGKWLRTSARASFDDLKDFYQYILDRDHLAIFGITKSGLFITSDKSRKMIKEKDCKL
jgi:hypothetical protein